MESGIKTLFWRQNSIRKVSDHGRNPRASTEQGGTAAEPPKATKSLSLHSSISSAPSERPQTAPKPTFPTPPLDPSIFKAQQTAGPKLEKAGLSKTEASHHDLIHAAVDRSPPSRLVRTPSDYYNENIAERNSKLKTPTDAPKADPLRHGRSARERDSQRATIEKMRASQPRSEPVAHERVKTTKPRTPEKGCRIIIQPPSPEGSIEATSHVRARPCSSMSLQRPKRVEWVDPRARPASRTAGSYEHSPRIYLNFDTPLYGLQDSGSERTISRSASATSLRVQSSSEDDSEIIVKQRPMKKKPMKRAWLDLTEPPPESRQTSSVDELILGNSAPEAVGLGQDEPKTRVVIQELRVDSAQTSPVEDSMAKESHFTETASSRQIDPTATLAEEMPDIAVRQPQSVPKRLMVDVSLANTEQTQHPVAVRACTVTIHQPAPRFPPVPLRIASQDFAQQPRRVRNGASSPPEPTPKPRPTRRRPKPRPTTASIDAIIATKKEAAARALVKLHEVMAIPIPEEPELQRDHMRPSSSLSERMARAEHGMVLVPMASLPLLKLNAALTPADYVLTQRPTKKFKRRNQGRPRADSPTLPMLITT